MDETDKEKGQTPLDILDTRELLRILIAVKKGDFTVRLPEDKIGLAGKIADTLNDIIEANENLASELEQCRIIVGKDGKTSHRVRLKNSSGSWAVCADSVNNLITDMVQPTAEMFRVIDAVVKGDLTQTMPLEIEAGSPTGEFLRTAEKVNTMVDQLNTIASEVTRVTREVGTEGKLGVKAEVEGVSGTWKELTDNVNLVTANLTEQVRNIAEVTTAVAKGDLTKHITVDAKGEIRELKDTINTMVDQLSTFASEVTRVTREVGTEGRLGRQAEVEGVSGTWKDLTDNVNLLNANLANQVRNIAEVTTAVAMGNLTTHITVDAKGEILELKNTINTMVDQLSTFAYEVTRVAREVGTEGKLGGQAEVEGVSGTWKDLTVSVNSMAANLTAQVRNIAEVAIGIANGDLSKKITVDVRGEFLQLKDTINKMVDYLNQLANEVGRVTRLTGEEGKLTDLTSRAMVEGVTGVWKNIVDTLNFLLDAISMPVTEIGRVVTAISKGDLSQKMPLRWDNEMAAARGDRSLKMEIRAAGDIKNMAKTINRMLDDLNTFALEVTRVSREVGTEGKLGGQAHVPGVAGTWKDLTDSVNFMALNLTNQVRNIAAVTTAIATGDLSKKITVDAWGEILELKNTINNMVDQLNSFASEVTRVAREVGTEGKLGGQGSVQGVAGTWKDLTDSVNTMAANLTDQVRGIARVVTAVAMGDLKRKLTVDAKGEVAELTDTINNMIDTLAIFAAQVTTVAREVGVEGKLGGQANVPGAAGTWRDLTDNVNRLAANLTAQVRAITSVATAVAKGDLSRTIDVEAAGEVETLKDNVNGMIRNLIETTRINTEQDWLKTNLAGFNRILQGQGDLLTVARIILAELAPLINVQHGAFFVAENTDQETTLRLFASYGFQERKNISNQFRPREGLIGQCFVEKQRIHLTNVPDNYVKINSGLGEATPLNIVALPILFEDQVLAIFELASFNRFTPTHLAFLDQLTESIGIVMNTIQANMRTDELLKQSQTLTEELQKQQENLQQTNEDLEEKAHLLVQQKTEVERKNREVEQTKQALVDKAEQLALTSKYKSEFLANMSHELRTPLNSLLILAQQLAENTDDNLTPRQVEFANTIHASGSDLLSLINDILDLSKIESGVVKPDLREVLLSDLCEHLERTFRHVAQNKGLEFVIETDPFLPPNIYSDSKRLEQVLKNLLSNAFKFTEKGRVLLEINQARGNWSPDNKILNQADTVVVFSIRDTGIGIAPDKQKIIFEAFQQADGSTSRKYGGTGLGLAISREIATLLGGEIQLESTPRTGSTFSLYLPLVYRPLFPANGSPIASAVPTNFPPQASVNFEMTGTLEDMSLTGPDEWKPGTDITPEKGLNDDRYNIKPDDHVVLIVEDDLTFAQILLDIAHDKGFKGIITSEGYNAYTLIKEFKPKAITLDLQLPDIDGWTILDRLKLDPATRHIPVHIISVEQEREYGLQRGALAYLEKPVNLETLNQAFDKIKEYIGRHVKELLLIHDNGEHRQGIEELIGNSDVHISYAGNGTEALKTLEERHFDCVVMDLKLPDMMGYELIEAIQKDPLLSEMPIIVYPAQELSIEEKTRLEVLAKESVLRRVWTPERLLDETSLFLHRVAANLPESKRKVLERIYLTDEVLANKKVLLVDDDVRNIFALTSMLERHQLVVLSAENGREGLELLEKEPDIHIVLMDIMMPEMDGYEAMVAIRQNPRFESLPVIALTAKAMKGDREKCIEAGASDYITKPVDIQQLLSLLRVWLYR